MTLTQKPVGTPFSTSSHNQQAEKEQLSPFLQQQELGDTQNRHERPTTPSTPYPSQESRSLQPFPISERGREPTPFQNPEREDTREDTDPRGDGERTAPTSRTIQPFPSQETDVTEGQDRL